MKISTGNFNLLNENAIVNEAKFFTTKNCPEKSLKSPRLKPKSETFWEALTKKASNHVQCCVLSTIIGGHKRLATMYNAAYLAS